jgi:epoxyqueuosine reductase
MVSLERLPSLTLLPALSLPPFHSDADDHLAARLKSEARRIGFDLVGITTAVGPGTLPDFEEWLDAGYAGEMGYLERRREAYADPQSMLKAVRSVIMLGVNYYSGDEPEPDAGAGRIARYARIPADYHDVLRGRLQELAIVLHEARPGCRTRSVVDTAPLLERDFARRAGLGWFGKNTMLLNKRMGSWFFLAALLTDVDLPADAPHETAHCGTCTRCIDACPTDAFVEPYVLDARRCISYLTIELGPRPIDDSLLPGMQDWAFGCDICQDVCPWNRKAPVAIDPAFRATSELGSLRLADLLRMDESAFLARYGATPLARTGYEALVRNACIAVGNAGTSDDLPALVAAQELPSLLIRDAATWSERELRKRVNPRLEESGCIDSADLAGHSDAVQTG